MRSQPRRGRPLGAAASPRRLFALSGFACAGALAVATLPALAGSVAPGALEVQRSSGRHAVVYRPGTGAPPEVLRQSGHRIESAELTALDALGVRFATWDEFDPTGRREHYTSVNKGGAQHWSQPRRLDFSIPLTAGALVPGTTAPAISPDLVRHPAGALHIVQFRTMGLAAWRQQLAALGAEVLSYLPHNAHIVRMDPGLSAAVSAQPFVRWVGPFHPAYKLPSELRHSIDTQACGVALHLILQTLTPGLAEKALLAREVEAAGGRVLRVHPGGYLLEAELTPAQLALVAHSDHLVWVDRWSEPVLAMDLVRDVTGANYVETVAGYDGSGVNGEVMDDGIDPDHQDLDGYIPHGVVSPGAHGTATYGILFGNGRRDGDGDDRATGMLPAAQGYIADFNEYLYLDRYAHIAELLQPPWNASFQSNSWGTILTRAYVSMSFEMDDIVWQYDLPIFYAQHNSGNQYSSAEAWGKNIIAVGGINHYESASLADDCWCGDASVGPALDGRVKPDLVHFYDAIYVTDQQGESGPYGNGYNVGGDYHPNFSGTSAATPIVAGVGGLVLQMWADDRFGNSASGTTVFERRPHASTLKALLINGAERYPFTDSSDDLSRYHQGWGLASAQRLYDRAPRMAVIDESSVLFELERDIYQAAVPPSQGELSVTMVYTDRGGSPAATEHRVNDVTLRVVSPGGIEYWGNVGLEDGNWSTPGGSADRLNTVENVFVANPEPGDWTVEVIADEINQDVHAETAVDDQDYALVVYGVDSLSDCSTSVPPPANLVAVPATDNEVRVSWTGTAPDFAIYRAIGGCTGELTLAATVSAPVTTFTDTGLSGGATYGYIVRGRAGGCRSQATECVEVIPTGACLLAPVFEGVVAAGGSGGPTCGITVTWAAAQVACGGPAVYNIYRDTTAGFVPSAANRVAECVGGTIYLDIDNIDPTLSYYYVVQAAAQQGQPAGICGGPDEANQVERAGMAARPVLDQFETGWEGWVGRLGSPPAASGAFVRGDPIGVLFLPFPTLFQAEDDHTPAPGTQCLFTGQNPGGDGDRIVLTGGEVVLTSRQIDLSGFTNAQLSLWWWLHPGDFGNDMDLVIELSNDDGQSWAPPLLDLDPIDIWWVYHDWNELRFDLETALPLTAEMRIRVRAGTNFANWIEAAIDDVTITSVHSCVTERCLIGNLSRRTGLLGVKAGNDAVFEWEPDTASPPEYHLNVVTARTQLNEIDAHRPGVGVAGEACTSAAPGCTHVGAISPPDLLFYQALSACGTNGLEEGPMFTP